MLACGLLAHSPHVIGSQVVDYRGPDGNFRANVQKDTKYPYAESPLSQQLLPHDWLAAQQASPMHESPASQQLPPQSAVAQPPVVVPPPPLLVPLPLAPPVGLPLLPLPLAPPVGLPPLPLPPVPPPVAPIVPPPEVPQAAIATANPSAARVFTVPLSGQVGSPAQGRRHWLCGP